MGRDDSANVGGVAERDCDASRPSLEAILTGGDDAQHVAPAGDGVDLD
jgi:hypothetical protein